LGDDEFTLPPLPKEMPHGNKEVMVILLVPLWRDSITRGKPQLKSKTCQTYGNAWLREWNTNTTN
jgi:hypothetical protein